MPWIPRRKTSSRSTNSLPMAEQLAAFAASKEIIASERQLTFRAAVLCLCWRRAAIDRTIQKFLRPSSSILLRLIVAVSKLLLNQQAMPCNHWSRRHLARDSQRKGEKPEPTLNQRFKSCEKGYTQQRRRLSTAEVCVMGGSRMTKSAR